MVVTSIYWISAEESFKFIWKKTGNKLTVKKKIICDILLSGKTKKRFEENEKCKILSNYIACRKTSSLKQHKNATIGKVCPSEHHECVKRTG